MPTMNEQYHHLRENDAASHQSIVKSQPVAELNISNLTAKKLLKVEPNHDSYFTTARLKEKSYYPGEKGLQPISFRKSWVISQKNTFLSLVR